MDRPDFPTMEQVERADHEQLAKWYRFLPAGDTPEQRKIQRRLAERFQKMGGLTPELSKKIGSAETNSRPPPVCGSSNTCVTNFQTLILPKLIVSNELAV